MENFEKYSFIFSTNATYIKELYQKFLHNPASIDQSWSEFFTEIGDNINSLIDDYQGASWRKSKLQVVGAAPIAKPSKQDKSKQIISDHNLRCQALINAYRKDGHNCANLDPLGLQTPEHSPSISPEFHGITDQDLGKTIKLEKEQQFNNLKINEAIGKLQQVYCDNIAYEFSHVIDNDERNWLYQQIENQTTNISSITNQDKLAALDHLHNAASFEQMLHKKFPGAKRFSVEGGDVVMASIEQIISQSATYKVNNIEIGMAHRGRLNILVNVMDKPVEQMIAEFMGKSGIPAEFNAQGDVKYHMGYSADRNVADHPIHLSLAYNPSHLEAANSVVMGKVRAKQDLEADTTRSNSLPIIIHGDAAMMGQGTVAETFNMAYTQGYFVGGSLHIVINNQVGFTANPDDSRSSKYCSDIAKIIAAPIIHVNGEDVAANLFAAKLATDYRQKFSKDIVIDICCYRKYGHNEGDEPNYTQPTMYEKIRKMQSLDQKYGTELIQSGIITSEEFAARTKQRHDYLETEFVKADKFIAVKPHAFSAKWSGLTTKTKAKNTNPETGLPLKLLKQLGSKLVHYPDDFPINKKIAKQYLVKKKIMDSGEKLDWSLGEALGFASLVNEQHPVRITGQDAGRGTFSHRHSVLHGSDGTSKYLPLNNISEKQAAFEVHDSVLSEFSILGFEHGYSLSNPNCLAIWEAQFGDFANGAQTIFDQFITSSEAKWLRMSGLVVLLPHGFEGQGPEHSSARLERYLQSCADENIQVANITNPANLFHIFRRQLHRDFRKPLIIMTPKSLLRHKLAVSNLADFAEGTKFQSIISEQKKLAAHKKIKKVIFCSGKIYYDLFEAREKEKINDIAIIRIEELYPFPETEITKELKKYPNAEIIWCQEEPENMGAWHYIDRRLEKTMIAAKTKSKRPLCISRKEAASPATGYMSVHIAEQQELLKKALS
jgi:2-oxoglutarate dehydrogenase E1 component